MGTDKGARTALRTSAAKLDAGFLSDNGSGAGFGLGLRGRRYAGVATWTAAPCEKAGYARRV